MKWSKYNHLFRSKRHGWLLYNSAANTFAQIDDAVYPEIVKIQKDSDAHDFGSDVGLYFQLRDSGVLVEERGDEVFRNVLKMLRLQNNYDTSQLMLTIAPTRACNFDCAYCYEQARQPVYMSDKTEDAVVDFITSRRKTLKRLLLTWYGGEPLLCLPRLCSLTERIKALDLPFEALLVTNGYLLDDAVIDKLKELKISRIQVTIDGDEATHNTRRPLKGGGATYQKVLRNTEALLRRWEGTLLLRVNIDRTNKALYPAVHKQLQERFSRIKGKARVSIYPGIVHDHHDSHPDVSCLLDRDEEARFAVEGYYEHGLQDLGTFPGRSYGGCIACRKNGYVVGPEGELYKCWDDFGIPERRIGSVHKEETWNMALVADYLVGSSYLDDPECSACFFLPVCDGGCPRVRLNNQLGRSKTNVCLKFKGHLEDLLEIYYEQKEKATGPNKTSDAAPTAPEPGAPR